ncbi:uncharacterized protein LOC123269804 [Cotesia glomerata]|uniref:uncharacterized protein LOC123269804 n=1 Tax=Cotesia glomerata TaxID=32391 RepID=UPI001D02B6E8|nr:uncharacterized protein LOC123269804 [Cotesia glomerata]
MKTAAKKYSKKLKEQSMGTGGGGKIISSDPVFDAALNFMHHLTVEGLHNEFDNDAESTINDIIYDNDTENDCRSESDVFEYLVRNNQINDWKKGGPSNLKSAISAPLKVKNGTQNKPNSKFSDEEICLKPKDELALLLLQNAHEKHKYEIELLKLQIKKEFLLIQKIKGNNIDYQSDEDDEDQV